MKFFVAILATVLASPLCATPVREVREVNLPVASAVTPTATMTVHRALAPMVVFTRPLVKVGQVKFGGFGEYPLPATGRR